VFIVTVDVHCTSHTVTTRPIMTAYTEDTTSCSVEVNCHKTLSCDCIAVCWRSNGTSWPPRCVLLQFDNVSELPVTAGCDSWTSGCSWCRWKGRATRNFGKSTLISVCILCYKHQVNTYKCNYPVLQNIKSTLISVIILCYKHQVNTYKCNYLVLQTSSQHL
jgi:hypothetical protein